MRLVPTTTKGQRTSRTPQAPFPSVWKGTCRIATASGDPRGDDLDLTASSAPSPTLSLLCHGRRGPPPLRSEERRRAPEGAREAPEGAAGPAARLGTSAGGARAYRTWE